MSKHSKCICTYEKMDETDHKGATCFRPFCLLGKSPNPYEKYNIFYFSIEFFSKIQPCDAFILLNFSSKNDILSL